MNAEPQQRLYQGLRFVRRMHLPRTLGFALGALCIGAVLWTNGASAMHWAALAVSTLAWPHAALWLGRYARDPYRAELRSLTVDSALGGAWIALMGFNLLPSVVVFAMLSMDKLAIGGVRFFTRCTAAMAAACAVTAFATGFEFQPETSMAQIAGSLPLLVVYPLLVGIANHRLARPASLLMIDIDNFKAINDRHGHPAGDEVIRAVAAILRNTLREQDLPGRYGGEEFGVLLPETDTAGAEVLAERLRRLVATSVLERSLGVRTTVSIGIAACESDTADYAEWISRADRALYSAKRLGRDRVERFDRLAAAPNK